MPYAPPLDERASSIIEAAKAGRPPSEDDVAFLLGFPAESAEAAAAVAAARDIGMRACEGRGYLYAQIGIDALPCPEQCAFCAFAACNNDLGAYDAEDAVADTGLIVHYAQLFDRLGMDLVSLMATSALDFNRYLGIVATVRSAVSDRLAIMANVGDISRSQAERLAEAGATCAYHSIRLGEGAITAIDPDTRRATLRNLKAAGLGVMTGIEPIWDGIDAHELAQRICEVAAWEPFAMGACSLTPIEGSHASAIDLKPASKAFVRYAASLARLACGTSVPVGGIGGVAWVDAGTDPRKRGYGSSDEELSEDAARARRRLGDAGFVV